MAEIKQPVSTVKVEYLCDDCGIGHMTLTHSINIWKTGPWYQHCCPHCHAYKELDKAYPAIEYKPNTNYNTAFL
jgi:hypothetical protein